MNNIARAWLVRKLHSPISAPTYRRHRKLIASNVELVYRELTTRTVCLTGRPFLVEGRSPRSIVGHPQPISDSEAASVPSRQCGRCRAVFPGDPTIPFGTMPDWWLCPPCHTA